MYLKSWNHYVHKELRLKFVKGCPVSFVADNLGSNAQGGFKLSFSFSYRYKDDAWSSFDYNKFTARCTESHKKHCEINNGPSGAHYCSLLTNALEKHCHHFFMI